VSPSTAFFPANPAALTEEATTGRPFESNTSFAASAVTETISGTQSTTVTPAPSATTLARRVTRQT
jgi:hypothetical protein